MIVERIHFIFSQPCAEVEQSILMSLKFSAQGKEKHLEPQNQRLSKTGLSLLSSTPRSFLLCIWGGQGEGTSLLFSLLKVRHETDLSFSFLFLFFYCCSRTLVCLPPTPPPLLSCFLALSLHLFGEGRTIIPGTKRKNDDLTAR